jgi:hypothetical protein
VLIYFTGNQVAAVMIGSRLPMRGPMLFEVRPALYISPSATPVVAFIVA